MRTTFPFNNAELFHLIAYLHTSLGGPTHSAILRFLALTLSL